MAMNKDLIAKQARIELAKRDFFRYCNIIAPDFYKPDRQFLVDLCNEFQDFPTDDNDILVINVPPRHGKSRTAGLFVQWQLGRDKSKKIMTGSYNETLSTVFSKSVRNAISEIKADENRTVFNDIFPDVKIKHGDGAMNLWSLEGGYNNYLATSPGGTATGFGADLIIVDDLIKNADEAFNANILEGHWEWFTNTMLSRLEDGGKIMIVMTRWHSDDLAGKALSILPDLGYKVKHINFKALQDDGTMLDEEILSRKEYDRKTKAMSEEIANANYQQTPIDIRGRLYSELKTYDELVKFKRIESYTDTADQGKDYLATFIYGVTFQNEAYILDVVYTKDGMEVTEPLLAEKLVQHNVNVAHVESNNGGRGFARSVEKIMKTKYKTNKTVVRWFHQSKNKIARILSNSTWIMEHVYFPEGWRNRWPELYTALMTYQKEGKNKHDDAPDALTGIAEKMGSKQESNITSNYSALLKGMR